ncbi:MAG: DUF3524 domain-containing protein [Phycisphaerales bacterium]|nr:DUF3524 domain-containing protein [Phycisphaerales bacterium]
MPTQLDIIALEPFYGGIRKLALETLIRHSRHRWTVLKLPPRRIERRLMAAATWFSEQLTRHWVGRADILLTSEALNLADFHRFMPSLARVPSVVYFHSNQLPPVHNVEDDAVHLVNLNTAQAATEIWFNSLFHLRDFLHKASALVSRHPELSGRNPMPELIGKAQHMPPPIDWHAVEKADARKQVTRMKRRAFVDTRDANIKLINAAYNLLQRRADKWNFITVGPVDDLAPEIPRQTIVETDEAAQIQAMYQCSVMISTKIGATCDQYAIFGLAAGCFPIWPRIGIYPELLPNVLHPHCLYDGTAQKLASLMQDVYYIEQPSGYEAQQRTILNRFDPLAASRAIDRRLDELAARQSLHS